MTTQPIWERSSNKYYDCWQKVNRNNFIPEEYHHTASNHPISIGESQTTSQPTLITSMLALLFANISKPPYNNIKALDIGSGSGIVSALLACILKKNNEVTGIDIFDSLIQQSKTNISKISPQILDTFAKIKLKKLDAYKLFEHPDKLGKFDIIYVGAEPKTQEEINKFKNGIPMLLTPKGVAIAPIEGRLQLWSNKRWTTTSIMTRFVPLQGGTNEKNEKALIKEENETRWSVNCKATDKICKNIAITSRTTNLYKNHLFPDFKNQQAIDKWIKNKCIVDIGSGINTISKYSFISRLTRKNLGLDVVGTDIKNMTKKSKQYARFVHGNAKTMKLNLNPKCKNKKIILINNLLYLWIDNPTELIKFYKNMFSWLEKGSQIRIFPVYFGRYDMYNKKLKHLIETHSNIKIKTPKYTTDNYYQWHITKSKKIHVKKSIHNDEKEINEKLQAKTVILIMK